MLRKPGNLGRVAITTFWLVMLAIFCYREGWLISKPAPTAASGAFVPQNQWMGIFLEGGERVGVLHLQTAAAQKGGRSGYRLNLNANLETSLFGFTTRMDIGGKAWTSADGTLTNFDFSLTAGDTTMGAQGTVQDKHLKGTLNTGGQVVPIDFPLESNPFSGRETGMPGSGFAGLKKGESTTIDTFDPATMKMGKGTVSCVGEEPIQIAGQVVQATVYTTTVGKLTSKAWIGADEEVLQATTPFGFILRKILPEDGTEPGGQHDGGDMIRTLAINASGKPVFVGASRMVLRVSGIEPDAIPDDPPWQIREGDLITLRQSDSTAPSPEATTTPFDPAPYLAGDAFVTASHPRIIAQSQEIVGNETDPWKRAVLLYQWIFENIEKVPVLSVPNALDVLRTRTGDCNEHAVLFTALARAANIPTRIAIGLVYSDTLGGFGYHAWPEVHCGDTWVAMDPTLGQVLADATHLKLLNGSIEAWVGLAAYIGQIKLEVLAVE